MRGKVKDQHKKPLDAPLFSSFYYYILLIAFLLLCVWLLTRGIDGISHRKKHLKSVKKDVLIGEVRSIRPTTTRNESHIYGFMGITKQGKKNLRKCAKFGKCSTHRSVYGYAIDEYTMVDHSNKILMEFTPKADCTAAVVAFLEAFGFEQDVHYSGWPHTFRDNYYNVRCGVGTPCMYFQPSWFRFKVVRNPYDRAVSSYLYVMRTSFLIEMLPKYLQNASFEQFIDYQLTLPLHQLQYFATRHAGLQSTYYERFLYTIHHTNNHNKHHHLRKSLENPTQYPENAWNSSHFPPIFHEIVKVESSKEGFDRIYKRTRIQFQLKNITKHYQIRNNNIQRYVGNQSWIELKEKGQVPNDYGYFYNKELKKKVEHLFYWDLLLYNYSFPFSSLHW